MKNSKAMIVKSAHLLRKSFTDDSAKRIKKKFIYKCSTGRRVYYGIKFTFKTGDIHLRLFPNTYGKTLEEKKYRLVRKVNYFVGLK